MKLMTGDGFTTTGHVVALGDKQGGFGNGIDLAIIKLDKLPSKVNSLSFADFEKVKIGQSVYVIGNSLGYGSCITSGIVSDKSRVVNGSSLLMTDCAVNSGNSGGPMFNSDGKIIGVIVSGITKAEGMNFAIKGDDVRNWVTKNGVYTVAPSA